MAAIIIGYLVLLVLAGLLGCYLGIRKDVDYERMDLTARGAFPAVNRSFPYNHLRMLGVDRLMPFKPQDEAQDSLPPTRPEGRRAD